MKLIAPTSKPIALKPTRPNAGIEADYRRRLHKLIEAMNESVLYWLSSSYKSTGLAQDALPAKTMQTAMNKLVTQWQRNFDQGAKDLAQWFADKNVGQSDRSMTSVLKQAGFVIDFTMTSAMKDAQAAIIGENVGLIRSIAQKYLTDVQGMVMRSVALGRDLHTLTNDLQKTYGVTRRRASFIARDQNNKATAVNTRTRQEQLGLTQAIWRHSSAGKVPRPSHVAASGEIYDIKKGMYLDGVWTFPGHEINCLPSDSVIEFAAGCQKLWRRRYAGKLTEIVTDTGKSIKATPNHPVLTNRGWIPISLVNNGDYVIGIGDEAFNAIKTDINTDYAKISDIFDAISFYVPAQRSATSKSEFHGDVTDKEVETIDIASFLPSEFNSFECKQILEFFFAEANNLIVANRLKSDSALASACRALFCASECIIGGFSALLPFLKSHLSHADDVSLRLSSDLNSMLDQAISNQFSGCSDELRDSKFAHSRVVFGNNNCLIKMIGFISKASIGSRIKPIHADVIGDRTLAVSCNVGYLPNGKSLIEKKQRVIHSGNIDFSGHVYNLETESNWYSSSTLIIHNCRCFSQPVIPGFDE